MTGVGCLIITDGRGEYLEKMWASLKWDGPDFAATVLVDDSGDSEYGLWCIDLIKPTVFVHHAHRRGLAGAIASGWYALQQLDVDYVLHLEEDFTFPEAIPLADMLTAFDTTYEGRRGNLAQVALKRQPWSPEEIAAGGFMDLHPDRYSPVANRWTVQQTLFTFNPCLYPAWVMNYGPGLEADLTERLLADDHWFAYYGIPADPARCIHIGYHRSPAWML